MKKLLIFLIATCFSVLNWAQPILTEDQFSQTRTLLTAPLDAQTISDANATSAYCLSADGSIVYFAKQTEKGIELFTHFKEKGYDVSLALVETKLPTSLVDLGNNILLVGINNGGRQDFYRFDLNLKKMIDSTPFLNNAIYIHQQQVTGTAYFVLSVKGVDFIYRLEKEQKNPIQMYALDGQFVSAFTDESGKIQGYVGAFEKYLHIYQFDKRTASLKVRREGKGEFTCINFNSKTGDLIALTTVPNDKCINSIEKINLNTGKSEFIIDSKTKPYTEITGWKFNISEDKFDFISFVNESGSAKNLTFTTGGKKIVEQITKETNNQNVHMHALSNREPAIICVFNENFPSLYLTVSASKITKINSISATNKFYSSVPVSHRSSIGSPLTSYIFMPKVEKDGKSPIVFLLNSNPILRHPKTFNPKAQFLVSQGFIVVLWNTYFSSNTFIGEATLSESLSNDLKALCDELLNQDYMNSINAVVFGESNAAPLVPFAIGNSENSLIHGISMNNVIVPTNQQYIHQFAPTSNSEWPEFGTMKFNSNQQYNYIGIDKINEQYCNQLNELNLNAKFINKNVVENAASLNFLLSRLNEIFGSKGVYNK